MAKQLLPKKRNVNLTEFTRITVDILPDLGVRLIFPFILDSSKLQPQFKKELTNENIFDVAVDGDSIKGQNTISITVKKPDSGGATFQNNTYLGNLFLSVDGYNITILLRTTVNMNDHFSDVVFKPDEKARDFLVEKEVQHIRKVQNEEYQKRLQELDKQALKKSISRLGEVILQNPDIKRIKEDKIASSPSGEVLNVYLDQFVDYDSYSTLILAYDHPGNDPFVIKDITVSSGDMDTGIVTIDSSYYCNTDSKCAIATMDQSLAERDVLTLIFSTSKGTFELSW